MNWDDLRYVLAIGRHGTLSAAARALGVNHSTVFRRLGQIESGLGVRLFERHSDGCTPTSAGEDALAMAERLEGDVLGLERRLAGRDTRPSGTVRVTTTDTLLTGVLGPALAAFTEAHPRIDLDIVVENRFLSLSKRDADVAIRPSASPPETLVGRRVATLAWAIYASSDHMAQAPPAEDLTAQAWIAPDESLAQLAAAQWLRRALPGVRPVLRANSLLGLWTAARSGVGLALLPCFLGDSAPELRRVRPPLDELAGALWLLTHRDLRQVARVRAFLDVMDAELRRLRPTFEGDGA